MAWEKRRREGMNKKEKERGRKGNGSAWLGDPSHGFWIDKERF